MKSKGYLCVFMLLTIITACTPKVADTVTEKKEDVVEVKQPEMPSNPCTTLAKLKGYDREQVETAYVLYKDLFKLKEYKKALDYWKKAYYGAPAANGSIKYQFEDGITMYKHFYANENDTILKQSYLDTIIAIYDKRVECFGEPAYIEARKAFDYYYYFQGQISSDSIYNMFKPILDAKGKKVNYFVVNPFTKILSDGILNETIPIDEGGKYAELIWDAIEYGIASGKNAEAWDIIKDYAPSRLENLEGIKDLYSCEYYDKKYMADFNANPEDCEVINTAYRRLAWGGCDKNGSSMVILKAAKDKNCYTPPPPPGTLRQAFDAYQEGDYNAAVKLFSQFVEETDDIEKKYKYNLLIAKIYYGDIKNYSKSRQFALKASDLNPSSGEPFLLIGKLYASSGPLCGPGRGWDSQIVTWPAIDMFEKAKKDPLVAEEANKFIRTYWQYMPKKEDIFQRNIKAGSTFKVGCWINRTTTVRTAN